MSTTSYVIPPFCPECLCVDVQEMTMHLPDGRAEQYFHCPNCDNKWRYEDGRPEDRWRWDKDKL
ncbi:MAG: hypothetical protein OEW12_00375 [Deltaproteobacteria bacterium]|nr:hypothetical protein [Deltaproteobacteria bacterium]